MDLFPDLFQGFQGPPRLFPDYKGDLAASTWSGFQLTPQIEKNLKLAALRNCPTCSGDGYVGPSEVKSKSKTVQLCSCVHRREEWRPHGR